MKKIYSLCFFIFCIYSVSKAQCTLSLDSVYVDSANSTCNYFVLKYDVSGGTATSYLWNYGDGNSCTCLHPKNFYTSNGSFQVCGRIQDAKGCADSICITLSVNCSNPCDLSAIGIYTADTLSYTCNEIEFNTVTSANAKKIKWDFGDGDSSEDKFVVHTFKDNKTYNVRLVIQDSIACADTADFEVTIDCPEKPKCNFKITHIDTSTGGNCKSKTFKLNSNARAMKINWNYGDGTSSMDSISSTHVYSDTGRFEVCVIAEDSLQCKDTLCSWLDVNCNTSDLILRQNEQFRFYPNPVNSQLHIELNSSAELSLYTISMQQLNKQFVTQSEITLNLSEFPSGVYILKIQSAGKLYYYRLYKD